MGVAPNVSALFKSANKNQAEVWVSAQGQEVGKFGLSWYSKLLPQGATALSGFRGHGVSRHPLRKASVIMYGRRPGTQAIEVNLLTGKVEHQFECAPGRHLFGHGCFSADGKVLFTAEADYEKGIGKIGVRDALTYQQIDEFDSFGVGPHELKLLPDGKTLVVANGGIHTHPSTGRKKLNLNTMSSSLTYLDAETGKKISAFKVPEPKASIRHLDVASDGTVAFGMQVQRVAAGHNKLVPLAGVHKPGHALDVIESPSSVILAMQDYAGSVVINDKTRTVGLTSPRGNIAVFWHLDTLQCMGYHQLHDVCGLGVSPDQSRFVLSNSFGQLRQLNAQNLKEDKSKRIHIPDMHWDNHMLVTTL